MKFPLRLSHPMPAAETIGLTLAEDHRATITKVQPNSPSAKAGLKRGDEIITANKATLISPADLAWALHHLRVEDTLLFSIKRGSAIKLVTLALPKNWRHPHRGRWHHKETHRVTTLRRPPSTLLQAHSTRRHRPPKRQTSSSEISHSVTP
ncbi:MAG: PDZ domain-containing protein [Akkermansiaceae bacterium]|nr:PDZ domain-containing protein [Akkermansiaceae bacterium]